MEFVLVCLFVAWIQILQQIDRIVDGNAKSYDWQGISLLCCIACWSDWKHKHCINIVETSLENKNILYKKNMAGNFWIALPAGLIENTNLTDGTLGQAWFILTLKTKPAGIRSSSSPSWNHNFHHNHHQRIHGKVGKAHIGHIDVIYVYGQEQELTMISLAVTTHGLVSLPNVLGKKTETLKLSPLSGWVRFHL